MSYVNLICPSCKNKHEVSNFYLKSNNLISSEELALNLCGCRNFKSTFDESVVEIYPNSIFTEKFQSQFKITCNASVFQCKKDITTCAILGVYVCPIRMVNNVQTPFDNSGIFYGTGYYHKRVTV